MDAGWLALKRSMARDIAPEHVLFTLFVLLLLLLLDNVEVGGEFLELANTCSDIRGTGSACGGGEIDNNCWL